MSDNPSIHAECLRDGAPPVGARGLCGKTDCGLRSALEKKEHSCGGCKTMVRLKELEARLGFNHDQDAEEVRVDRI